MTTPSPFIYYLAIGLHPPYALGILLVVIITGVWTTMLSAAEMDSGLGMLLFVQMFLASTGFRERARRGHFDPLLIRGSNRVRAVLAHWIVSALPGAGGWLILACVGGLRGSPGAVSALFGTRAAALFIVSALGWSGGFSLARGTAGFLWIGVLVAALLRRADIVRWDSAASFVICPFALLRPAPVALPAICAAVLIAAVPPLWIVRNARRLDIHLVERA